MMKRIFTSLLLLMAFLCVSAQEAKLVPALQKSGETGIATTNDDNVYIDTNATLTLDAELTQITGTTVDVTITVSKGETRESLLYNDIPVTEGIASKTGISLTTEDQVSALFKAPGTITISGSYVVGENGAMQSFTNSLTVYVYNPITYEGNTGTQELIAGYAPNSAAFEVRTAGGNPSGWTYKWYHGNVSESEVVSTTSSCSFAGSTVKTTQAGDYSVEITNNAADNTPLFSTTVSGYQLTVYPAVTLTLSTDKTDIVSGYEDKVTLELKKEGGPTDGWTYEWYNGDEKLSATGPAYSYTPEAPSGAKRTDNIHVKTKCALNGKVLFEKEETQSLNVYQAVTFEMRGLNGLDDFLPEGRRVCLDGDVIKLGVSKQGGAGTIDDTNYWTVEWSVKKGSGVFGPYDPEAGEVAKNEQKPEEGAVVNAVTYSFRVKLTNKVNGKVIYESSSPSSLFVDVYPQCAQLPKTQDTYRTSPMSNRQIKLKSYAWGGYPAGWEYEWKRDGVVLPEEKDAILSASAFKNDTNNPIDVKYTVSAINSIGNRQSHEAIIDTYTVTVWPTIRYGVAYNSKSANGQIEENTSVNLFVDDAIKYDLSFSGGNPDGWTYDWTASGHVSHSTSADNKQFTVTALSKEGSSSFGETSQLTLKNTYDGEVWLDTVINLRYQIFNRGSVDEDIVYDGATRHVYVKKQPTVKLRVTPHEGYTGTDAWTYNWNYNILSDAVTHKEENVGDVSWIDTYTEMTCQVSWKNSILENVGSSGITNSLMLYLWPAANFGKVNATDKDGKSVAGGIRNGELVKFDCKASGAYEPINTPTWQYDWYFCNKSSDGKRDDCHFEGNATANFTGEGMGSYVQNCHLKVTNYGPDGVWDDSTHITPVKIYRAPRTPLKLVRKGNGNSNTLIVMFPEEINDDILEQNEYKFEFGYTDANGNDKWLGTVRSRYFQLTNGSVNDSSRKYYVYSVWDYPDGAHVTSNKRVLDLSNEVYFNGSDFSKVTRSDMTAIIATRMSEQVDIQGNHIDAHFDKPVKVMVSIYTLRGGLVKELFLGEKKDYNERVVLNGLTPGIYLLRYTLGSQVKVEKVVVK